MKKIYTLLLGLIFISSIANSQTIFAIQNTTIPNGDSPLMGNIVTTKGVVTGVNINTFAGTFYIQDGNGAWNGIYVFESGTPVAIGDSVMVTGTVVEFNNLTEIGTVTNVTILNSGNTLPAPTIVTTQNANMEEYEGVLINTPNAVYTNNPMNFGLWELNDGSGIIEADDDIFAYALIGIVGNTYNVTGIGHYSFSAFKILPRDVNDIIGAAGGPAFVSIFNIQNTTAPNGDSPELGNTLMTKGVVTGIVQNGPAAGTFFIQDGNGAWNGLYIFESGTIVNRGDSVEVTGTVLEFNNTTELGSVTNITILNSSNTLPTPSTITTGNAANMEEYEGVLIRVVNATYTNNPMNFGLWEMNDGSGMIEGDDDIYPYALIGTVGLAYDVTGIGHFSFGTRKILPRDANDISLATGVEELSSSNVLVYPNPVRNNINFVLDITNFNVKIIDITGKTVKASASVNNKLTFSVSSFNNGIYFYSIIDGDGNTIATNKFIVAK